MHELSIAMEILSTVEREAQRHGAGRIKAVFLDVGDLSGVETGSLAFCFEAIRGEWELTRQAELVIRRVPARYGCPECDRAFGPEGQDSSCPGCGRPTPTLLEGNELNVVSLEIE